MEGLQQNAEELLVRRDVTRTDILIPTFVQPTNTDEMWGGEKPDVSVL